MSPTVEVKRRWSWWQSSSRQISGPRSVALLAPSGATHATVHESGRRQVRRSRPSRSVGPSSASGRAAEPDVDRIRTGRDCDFRGFEEFPRTLTVRTMTYLAEEVVSPPADATVTRIELKQVCEPPDIDDSLLERFGSSSIDRLVFDGFLRARRRSHGPLVALSERIMITNASAAELLSPSDRPRLWAAAREALTDKHRRSGEFIVNNGARVLASHKAVMANGEIVGALVQLSLPVGRRSPERSERVGIDDSLADWWALTDSERAVAELVAQGLTNRETGRRVYMSRHTVDSHLRQIFRKLNICSRVELARIAGEHCQQLQAVQ